MQVDRFLLALSAFVVLGGCSHMDRKDGAKMAARFPSQAPLSCTQIIENLVKNRPMTTSESKKFFMEIQNNRQLVWGANNTGCEAKADLMAEIAHEQGYQVSKVWVKPANSGDSLLVYLNQAGTEVTAWNYHVAILVKIEGRDGVETMVIDPSLFHRPSTLEEWRDRVSRLSDQYDTPLDFKESSKDAFFGPDDIINSSNRKKAIAKRDEILKNSSDLNDPVVLDGFLTKLRGDFADELKLSYPSEFEKLKVYLRDENFKRWFKEPLHGEDLMRQLESHGSYFGISTKEIKKHLSGSDFEASIELKKKYWSKIGEAFDKLTHRAEELLEGSFNSRTASFQTNWENPDFRQKWYSPYSTELWKKYELDL